MTTIFVFIVFDLHAVLVLDLPAKYIPYFFFFFQAEDGIRDADVTGVQTCALPICAREVAKMVGLSVSQVRAYVRAGFLEPTRGPHGELRFSFQDLVLLRTAKGLVSARIAPRRVRSALRKLQEQLPEGRPLRGGHIRAVGDRIVVGDGRASWSPESGQVLFDFETQELARSVAPLQIRARGGDATDWYERACDLEETAPDEARDAYRRALEMDPSLGDA